MSTTKRDFDKEAASWDQKPGRIKLAKDVAAAISQEIELTSAMDVLDFGCGTGLLSFHLQPLVRSITGADSSQGMLDIFRAKMEAANITNAGTRLLDVDAGAVAPFGPFHLIVSCMTLHHVKDLNPVLKLFHESTAAGGYLCVADLDPDDGRFHDDNQGVFHFGFDRAALRKTLVATGFEHLRDVTATEVVKPVAGEVMQAFSVFLMIGQKPGQR